MRSKRKIKKKKRKKRNNKDKGEKKRRGRRGKERASTITHEFQNIPPGSAAFLLVAFGGKHRSWPPSEATNI